LSTITPYKEKELLGRVAADDAAAFQELLTHFHQVCYRVSMHLLQDEHIAEDILQEAFLKVWMRRKQMPEVENFGGWLRTVTVNLVYDHISKQKKEKIKADRWLQQLAVENQVIQPDPAIESEFESLLNGAMKILSPRQREVFDLVKRQGYSREEAAQILGLGQETVKYHLDLAMKSIRAYCIKRIDPLSALIVLLAQVC
jgi:RNA polymerase sigma factor (sigma-70 family)